MYGFFVVAAFDLIKSNLVEIIFDLVPIWGFFLSSHVITKIRNPCQFWGFLSHFCDSLLTVSGSNMSWSSQRRAHANLPEDGLNPGNQQGCRLTPMEETDATAKLPSVWAVASNFVTDSNVSVWIPVCRVERIRLQKVSTWLNLNDCQSSTHLCLVTCCSIYWRKIQQPNVLGMY